ncbi:MAG: hypothetical protein MJ195_02795 [Mycoplasmoidaceae bacterium]|nr:hypothetical protein [Mycoplasmoidaceae bacterium]
MLNRELETNEKVEGSTSNNGFSIETTTNGNYVNFKFVIDETHKDFDKYKEKDFTFVLAFTFTNEETGETKQQILLEKPFVIHYVPEAETEYFELLLPSSYTCLKGEHLVSIISYLHKPDKETWPITSPLTSMSISGSGDHGGTIELDTTLPFDQQYEETYKFATTYLNLTPNDDTVAENFTVDITCQINGETRTYEDIVISYVPYNDNVTNPNEYIQDRTLSLMLGYVDDSGQQSETATA